MAKALYALTWATGEVPQVATQCVGGWEAVCERAGGAASGSAAASRVRRKGVEERRTAGNSLRG